MKGGANLYQHIAATPPIGASLAAKLVSAGTNREHCATEREPIRPRVSPPRYPST